MGSVSRLPSRGGALRWHPYHATTCPPPSSQPCSMKTLPPASAGYITNRQSHLNTPVSTLVTTCESFHLTKHSRSSSQIPINRKDRQDAKKAQKEKFENALKELAVYRLSDIWKETSYVTHSTRSTPLLANFPEIGTPQPTKQSTVQLPSPYTPTTQTFASPEQPKVQYTTVFSSPRRIPLRAFVHEILRRSKTAWPALQIALCYLDAVKSKVPNAIAEARLGEGLHAAEAALDSLFDSAQLGDITETIPKDDTVAVDCSTPETQISSPSSVSGNARRLSSAGDNAAPRRPGGTQPPDIASACQGNNVVSYCSKRRRIAPTWNAPLPPRPSPLLCPRRMFIAALILATKFTQDRVYSNRAWAKICGLDAREVSRCERSLGEALDWRLWVGKGMADEPTQFLRNFLLAEESLAKTASNNTPLTRSLSDSAALTGNSSCSDNLSADLRSAFKRSSSMVNIGLTGTRPSVSSSTFAMLSDPTTLILTPVNADLDAMESECGHGGSSSTPSLVTATSMTSSLSEMTPFSTSEYSFNPQPYNSLPSPPCSHFSPYPRYRATNGQISMSPYKPYRPPAVDAHLGFDPVNGYTFGLEGTLATSADDFEIYF